MCDDRRGASLTRPRWGALYAILLFVAVALVAVEVFVPAVVRSAMHGAVAVGLGGALLWWTRSNRLALDQLDWCACASGRVRMRVIASAQPPVPPRRETAARISVVGVAIVSAGTEHP